MLPVMRVVPAIRVVNSCDAVAPRAPCFQLESLVPRAQRRPGLGNAWEPVPGDSKDSREGCDTYRSMHAGWYAARF